MRVLRNRGAGGVEVLTIEERPVPEPGVGQVRVRVAAAGLNRADLLQRMGRYPAPPGWPADIPGLEYSGTVDAIGPEVTSVATGDRVMGLVGGGAMAEFLVTSAAETLAVPDNIDDIAAAAIPEAFLTAFDALVRRGRVAPGERVLIHAVGSGVGTAAVQVAKHLGAVVIGTSRTADKLDRIGTLGADEVIDTSRTAASAALTAPVNVILDFLGGPALDENLGMLARRGRLVLLGTLQGPLAERIEVSRILRNRLEVVGAVMRSRAADERADLVAEVARRLMPAFGTGALRPVLGAHYPLARAAEAHQAMEGNGVFGKIVVTF